MKTRTELTRTESPIDEIFRAFGLPTVELPMLGLPFRVPRAYAPPAEVLMGDGKMTVRLDLPGIDPEKDVKVTVHEGDLVIEGERKQRTEIKEQDYHRSEVYRGSFVRRFGLPSGVDESKITATYEKGVLEITVPGGPPPAPVKVRTIKVKTAA